MLEAFQRAHRPHVCASGARHGCETWRGWTPKRGAQACLAAIRQLALDVGIPKCLADLGVKEADIPLLAANALKDACGLTNPRTATQADIEGIFRGGHDGLTPWLWIPHTPAAPLPPPRVVATPAALELLALLQAKHGQDLMFHQSGGCCDNSAASCYLPGEITMGAGDVYLGDIGGCRSTWARPSTRPGSARSSSSM